MKKDNKNQPESGENLAVQTPAKRKKRKKAPIIIAGVVILLVVFKLVSSAFTPQAAALVTTTSPIVGDIQESISTSGNVISGEKKIYFAPVAGVLGQIQVKAGDAVKSGEILVAYNMDQMERSFQQAALQQTVNNSSYQGKIADSSEKQSKLNEAKTNLAVLDQQIADNKSYLKTLQQQLQQSQRDTSNALAEESMNLNSQTSRLQSELAGLTPNTPEYEAKSKEIQQVSSAVSRNTYLQSVASSSDYVQKMNDEIADVQERIKDYEEYRAEMKSQESTSENTIMDAYQKQEASASNEIAKLTYQQAEKDYYAAKQGVSAEFDGIVTECNAVEGASVTGGTQLLTLESSSDVRVGFAASKHDLEKLGEGQKATITISGNTYEGEISKIDRMAQTNASGTPMVGVEVKISNPDDKIILGLDAKLTIFTNKAENAILVPVEAINADKDGDFLFTVENGIVVRKPVVCGISSDTHTEIKEGITESDQIILASITAFEEGMAVTAIPAQ